MTRSDVETVRRFFDRPPGSELAELIHPEIEIYDYDLPDAGVYRGHEGLARYVASWEDAWAHWEWTLDEVTDLGGRVLALFTIRARSASGAETRRQNGIVFALRDAKVVRLEYYTTHAEACAAADVPSSSG